MSSSATALVAGGDQRRQLVADPERRLLLLEALDGVALEDELPVDGGLLDALIETAAHPDALRGRAKGRRTGRHSAHHSHCGTKSKVLSVHAESCHFTSYSISRLSALSPRPRRRHVPLRGVNARPRVLVREEIAEAGVELLRSRFDVDVDGDERPRLDHRPLRRDRDPLGDEADRRPDREGRQPEGDRPRGRGRRQRRRRRGDAARDRRRERARVEHRLGRRAHGRPARRARAQHPAGARGARRRAAGSARSGAASSSPRRRSACSASAGSASRSRAARVGLQMRVVAYDPFVSAERFRELGVESDTLRRRARARRLHHPAPAAERRDARRDRRRRDRRG